MLSDAVEVYQSPIEGSGLRARRPIARGEVYWRRPPDETWFHRDQIAAWPREKRKAFWPHCHQVSEDWFCGPEDGAVADPSDYENHSCDPNTGFPNDNEMAAMRDIAAGEELTYDYAMTELDDGFEMECRCGQERCRGIVHGGDYGRSLELQERYSGWVMGHIARSAEPPARSA